ncbi:MAG: transposase [Deltaproteobacteria bacterium]|nr:transposase [Dehalococcoidia bacterium]MCB9732116.1 transposase [Deltaproteobacteria bacterium]
MEIWIGADWDKASCVVAYACDGKIRGARVKRNPDAVASFMAGFKGDSVSVGIESGDRAWAALWRNAGATVYVFDGKKAARFAESMTSSGARDDARSAKDLLAMVQSPSHQARANSTAEPAVNALKLRLEAQQTATQDRTRLINRLRSLLRQYHPAIEEVITSVDAAWVLRVLELAPTAAAWNEQPADEQQKALSGSRRSDRGRIAAALGSDYGVVAPEEEAAARDRILMTVKVLKAAREACQLADRNLDALANDDKRIRALCATEGIGKVVGTGLAIAIAHAETHGNERDAASQHIGAAPVTSKSGTMGDRNPHITMRRTASSTMKAIAFLCGIQLVRNHAWAKAAFTHYKSRGKTTASAYRRITRSFLRVTRALLRDGSTFDEARYISALKSRRVEWAMAL